MTTQRHATMFHSCNDAFETRPRRPVRDLAHRPPSGVSARTSAYASAYACVSGPLKSPAERRRRRSGTGFSLPPREGTGCNYHHYSPPSSSLSLSISCLCVVLLCTILSVPPIVEPDHQRRVEAVFFGQVLSCEDFTWERKFIKCGF